MLDYLIEVEKVLITSSGRSVHHMKCVEPSTIRKDNRNKSSDLIPSLCIRIISINVVSRDNQHYINSYIVLCIFIWILSG